MTLDLYRQPSAHDCTLGRLSVDGVFTCWTLEDVIRDGPKVAHETAIPPGTYRVTITYSARFHRMLPLLLDVPAFEGIRIHPGNSSADTSGCILVGLTRDDHWVGESARAMDVLQPKIADAIARSRGCLLTIHNPDPDL